MESLKKHSEKFFKLGKVDSLAVGVINFQTKDFTAFQLDSGRDRRPVYFDLASLSKPLTNSLGVFAAPDRVSESMRLLLNHRAGLPSWGLLPRKGWKEIINSFPVSESETLYSDYSALRFMLEFNSAEGPTLHEVAKQYWDSEVVFWKNLPAEARTVQNGFVNGRPNFRCVHDPNAFCINDWVSHAGLFGTVEGVCKTLLTFDETFNLLGTMEKALAGKHPRFVNGWDTVSNPEDTLAGNGCGERTFGHLGFTGTSIWVDPVKKLGHVVLCNATKLHWYDKRELNQFRKSLGEFVWSAPSA